MTDDAPGCLIHSRVASLPFGSSTVSRLTWSKTPSKIASLLTFFSIRSSYITIDLLNKTIYLTYQSINHASHDSLPVSYHRKMRKSGKTHELASRRKASFFIFACETISRALSSEAVVMSAPEAMRAISLMRSRSDSGRICVAVVPSSVRFEM